MGGHGGSKGGGGGGGFSEMEKGVGSVISGEKVSTTFKQNAGAGRGNYTVTRQSWQTGDAKGSEIIIRTKAHTDSGNKVFVNKKYELANPNSLNEIKRDINSGSFKKAEDVGRKLDSNKASVRKTASKVGQKLLRKGFYVSVV